MTQKTFYSTCHFVGVYYDKDVLPYPFLKINVTASSKPGLIKRQHSNSQIFVNLKLLKLGLK